MDKAMKQNGKKLTRIFATIVAIFLAIALVFVGLYIIGVADHDCAHDDDCIVCICIEALNDDVLVLSGAIKPATYSLYFFVTNLLVLWFFTASSLINNKIRLNN